jgi:hypothetical protein
MQQPGLQASASKLKLDSLFLQWFSMPETQRLVRHLNPDVVPQQIALAPSAFEPQSSATQPSAQSGLGAIGRCKEREASSASARGSKGRLPFKPGWSPPPLLSSLPAPTWAMERGGLPTWLYV